MTIRNLLALLCVGAALHIGAAKAEDQTEGEGTEAEEASEEMNDVDREADEAARRGEWNRELKTVEEEVNNLKERVFRSKATLQLLKELVVEGASAGSRVVVWHLNRLGNAYSLESMQYYLDGRNVYTKTDPGGTLGETPELKVFEQTVPPGTHSLSMDMVLRGNGYGVFSYLRTYQFKVQSSYDFEIENGKITTVKVIATSRGGLRNFVDRPTVEYEERVDTIREE